MKKLLLCCIIALSIFYFSGVIYPQQKESSSAVDSETIRVTGKKDALKASKGTEGAWNVFLPFDGMWMPGVNPVAIGARNFKTLTNYSYNNTGIEGVNGYSKVSTSIISDTYYKTRSGYHYKKQKPDESHVLVQAYDYYLQYSKVYDNKTAIPGQGDFESTAVHTDLSYSVTTGGWGQDSAWADTPQTAWKDVVESDETITAWADAYQENTIVAVDTPRAFFINAPQQQVIYSNGVESLIWAGDEHRVAYFVTSASNVTNYITSGKNYTDRINNDFDDANNVATLAGSGATTWWVEMSTRLISGATIYVSTANTTPGQAVQVSIWNGTSWVDQGETDGTNGLTNTGYIDLGASPTVSKQRYLEGRTGHFYLFSVVGDASIYKATFKIPWQTITDTWDRVYRGCVVFQAYKDGNYDDYTLEVNQGSSNLYPIGAEVGGIDSSGHLIAMFSDRMQAVRFDMLTGNTNPVVSGVSYWNGANWATPASWYDSTASISGVTTLGQTGVLRWHPPDVGGEFRQTLFGVNGYAYKFTFSGVLGGVGAKEDRVIIDLVSGIPAPLTVPNFKFPVYHKDRVFLCGYLKGGEANRVDYCKAGAPDVWNGRDSSDDGRQSLYFGSGGELTAGKSLFNRYGSNVYTFLVMFQANSMYMLKGDTPDTFAIDAIATNIGCPAPQTLSLVEVGYEMVSEELMRNVLVWLSSSGPMSFDGAVIQPLRGIDRFFNVEDPLYVGAQNIRTSFAWYDSTRREWNLRVSTYWFVYDFYKRKWYAKDTGVASPPQCAFEVSDMDGAKYVYAGIDTGYLVRVGNGATWDGEAITHTIETGDFFFDGDGWNKTFLRRIKFAYEQLNEDATMYITHYIDALESGVSAMAVGMSGVTEGVPARVTTAADDEGGWLHRFKFVSTTESDDRAPRPLGYGYQAKHLREDE